MIQMIPSLGDEDEDESLEMLERPEVREEMEAEAVGDLDEEEVD